MASPQHEDGYTRIANEIMEALARFRIPGEARQMLDVIIRKTYGFNKIKDRISTSQLMAATGLRRGLIHRVRKRLLLSNLITVYKNVDSQILSYSFQKDYEKWKVYTKKYTVYKNVPNCIQKSTQTVPIIEAHKRKKDNNKRKGLFAPPTLNEVSSYCQERKNGISAQTFIDFYASKGWLIGKNNMKDWRAAIRTWEHREPSSSQKGRPDE